MLLRRGVSTTRPARLPLCCSSMACDLGQEATGTGLGQRDWLPKRQPGALPGPVVTAEFLSLTAKPLLGVVHRGRLAGMTSGMERKAAGQTMILKDPQRPR